MSDDGKPESANGGDKGSPRCPPRFPAMMARGAMLFFMVLAGPSPGGEPPVVPSPVVPAMPCVFQPVMNDEQIAACRRPEPTPARGILSAQSDAVARPPLVARPSLPCEIKPVMTDAEIDACRRR